MTSKITSLLIFLVHVSILQSQFDIYGTILDEDAQPYVGMVVELYDTEFVTQTDEDGFYLLESVPEGDYAMILHHPYGDVHRAIYLYEEDMVYDLQIRRRIEFDQIIVEGTRMTGEEPFNEETLDRNYIEQQNLGQDVPYLFNNLRSVVVNSDAGNGIGYTGLRIRGLDPGHVNVTVNGIPLNDSESQLVFWVDLPDILKSTEDIQIQRGLGTSSFGTGDFGASINLNTNKTHIKSYINADAGIGSFGTRKGSLALGTGLMNNRFSLDGRLSYLTSDGFIDRASADLRSFFLSGAYIGLKNSLRLNIINGHEVTYQAWNGVPVNYAYDKDLRTFNSAGQEAVKMPGDRPYEDEVDNYSQTHFQLFYNWVNERSEMSLAAFYTRGKGFFENYLAEQTIGQYNFYPIDSVTNDTVHMDDLVRRKWLDNHYYGINYSWTYEDDNWILKAGASLANYTGNHFGEIIWMSRLGKFKFPFEFYRNDANKLDGSVFLKGQRQLGDGLFVYGDAQYRHVQYSYGGGTTDEGPLADGDADFHFFNPRFGLTYYPAEPIKLFGSVAMSSREPNRNDYIQSGPNTRPSEEKLINSEVGVSYTSDRILLALYGYRMDYRDQLVLTGEINDVGEYARVNVDESYRMGVEMEVGWQVLEDLAFTGNATLSRNKIKRFSEFIDNWDTGVQDRVEYTNTDISFSPSIIGFAGLSYTIYDLVPGFGEDQKLMFEWNHKYVGEQYLDNTSNENSRLDDFLVGEAGFTYSLSIGKIKEVSLRFRVMNLYDEIYASNGWIYRFSSSDPAVIDGDPRGRSEGNGRYNLTGLYPQAGTHFLAGLNVKF